MCVPLSRFVAFSFHVLPCWQLLHPPASPADMSFYMLMQYVKLKHKFHSRSHEYKHYVPSGDGNGT